MNPKVPHPNPRQRGTKSKVGAVLVLAGALPVIVSFAALAVFGEQPYVQTRVHACLELTGSCIALAVAVLLSLRVQHDQRQGHLVWIAAALVAMGLVDAVHALEPFGVAWAWLRQGATLVGGLLFGLVWLRPTAAAVRRQQMFLVMVALAALAFALAVWRWPGFLPAPFAREGFSFWVKACNLAGGLGFVAAAAFFFRRYFLQSRAEDLAFSSQTLLFATAALLFGSSHVWRADWWAWHAFRLLAYGAVLVAAYQVLAALYRQIASYAQELERRVSERNEAERQLRAASLSTRSLLEASLDPLVTISNEGKIMDVNRATEEVTGVPRDRLIGSDFSGYFTEPQKARAVYEQVFSQGKVQDYPLAIPHTSGRVTDVLYNATVFRNEAGEVEGVFAAARDVTARKQAEERVRRAALYTRTLIEASLDPLVTIGKDGRIMDVNRATEEVTGVARERLIGSDFSNYFTEPERARQGYEQVFSQSFVQDYPLVIRRRSGQVVEVLYNATVFKNEAGEIEGVFAAARDITARRRAEREAQRLHRALRALIECNEAVVRATDEKSLLKQACEIAVEVGGYRMAWVGYAEQDESKTVRPVAQAGAEEGYLGTVNITWGDTERGRGPTGTAIRTGTPAICQDTLTDTDFTPWREEAQRRGYRSSIVLPLASEAGVFGSLSIYAAEARAFDAAEQRLLEELASDLSYGILALRARIEVRAFNAELEQRVRQRTAELEESNRELESFTYSVSHDLRAPLRHVDGFSKILLEEYGPRLDEAGRGYLERVRRGTQFMGRLVDDLLNLSRVSRQALSVQITGLGSLVEEARQELATELEGREVEWKIGELPFVECDPGLMKQVLTNLLSNALKFTRPRPRAVIEVGQKPGDGAPVIFVRDNGVGFHMKYADKLFGIFQRLHRQEDFEGTGVGLATVARILHKHGGNAWAEAELDKGATFYFTPGAAEASAERPAAQEVAA